MSKSGGSPFESERFQKTEELAQAAFALQELRYLAWEALKAWDNTSLRKAQRTGKAGQAMEALRAGLSGRDRRPIMGQSEATDA